MGIGLATMVEYPNLSQQKIVSEPMANPVFPLVTTQSFFRRDHLRIPTQNPEDVFSPGAAPRPKPVEGSNGSVPLSSHEAQLKEELSVVRKAEESHLQSVPDLKDRVSPPQEPNGGVPGAAAVFNANAETEMADIAKTNLKKALRLNACRTR